MLQFAVATLLELEHIWPLATRWRQTLSQLSGSASRPRSPDNDQFTGVNSDANYSVALGKTPPERSPSVDRLRHSTAVDPHDIFPSSSIRGSLDTSTQHANGAHLQDQHDAAVSYPFSMDDPFGADLMAFIRGEGPDWGGWNQGDAALFQANADSTFQMDQIDQIDEMFSEPI